MKRRDLMQAASAAVAGLLLPSWLLQPPTRKLLAPGFPAPRVRRVLPAGEDAEVVGHRLAAVAMRERERQNKRRVQEEFPDDQEAGPNFPPGPPPTEEEHAEFLQGWIDNDYVLKPKQDPTAVKRHRALLRQQRERLAQRLKEPGYRPGEVWVPLQSGGFVRLT